MPTSREQRESEKLLQKAWIYFPQLIVCTWYPISDEAIYYAEQIIKILQELIEKMKEEKLTNRKEGIKNARL